MSETPTAPREDITDDDIRQMQRDARQLRNGPKANRCAAALAGDADARASLAHIRLHGHDFPRGRFTDAERAWVATNVDDPAEVDEVEAKMLARIADEIGDCWCRTRTPRLGL